MGENDLKCKETLLNSECPLEALELIGSGRFGSVYRAHSIKFNSYFALKTIPKGELTTDAMFENEVNILRSLCHPNIVNLYSFFTTSISYNMMMELCNVGSLKTEVKKCNCFKRDKFVSLFRPLLESIQYFHNERICHRDLKPENILFDAYGRIKIADWGQAIRIDNDQGIVNTYCGTLSYASPECLKKEPYNAFKSDMYSLGVCMYFTVLGKVPWTETVPIQKRQQILDNEFLIPPYIDNDIANVIRDLINLDPEKRPSAEELLQLPLFKDARIEGDSAERQKKLAIPMFSRITNDRRPSSTVRLAKVQPDARRPSLQNFLILKGRGSMGLANTNYNYGIYNNCYFQKKEKIEL